MAELRQTGSPGIAFSVRKVIQQALFFREFVAEMAFDIFTSRRGSSLSQ